LFVKTVHHGLPPSHEERRPDQAGGGADGLNAGMVAGGIVTGGGEAGSSPVRTNGVRTFLVEAAPASRKPDAPQ